MMKRTFLSLVSMVFIAAMTLTSCDEIMSAIDNPVGSYVQFPSTELTLQIGEDRPFQATTISPAKITYKSSDESVVTIDPQGFVTGIAFGEATITASVPATEYYAAGEATCKVKVGSELAKALKEGAIVSFDLNVDGVDESVSFKKVGDNFVIENPMASAPRRAASITTSYSLGYNKATNIMTLLVKQTDGINTAYPLTVIFDLNKNTMQIIPGSPLSTVLFVNIKINGVTITGKLTKKEVAPTSVVIKGAPTTPFEMNVGGGDVTLTADVLPNDATDKSVTWSSSNTAVATVDKTGKVHAVAVGTATIKAVTSNGKEATVELTVKEASITLNLTSPAVGQLICDDGKNYEHGSVPSGVKAVAKICFVIGTTGRALALKDDANDAMKWVDANSIAVAHQPVFSNGTWRLPNSIEWQAMKDASGGYVSLRNGFEEVGGTNMANAKYWGASVNDTNATYIDLYSSAGSIGSVSKDSNCRVRAVLVF